MSLLFIQLYTVKHYIFYLIFLNVFLHNNLLDLNESLGFSALQQLYSYNKLQFNSYLLCHFFLAYTLM